MTVLLKFCKTSLLIGLVFLGSSCESNSLKEKIYVGETQGSTYAIKIIDTSNEDLQSSIDSLLLAVDFVFSNYNDQSLLTAVNRPVDSIKVNPMFAEVFEQSKEIYTLSNKIFDPTVGALVKTWGFGNSTKTDIRKETIDSLILLTGLEKVSLTSDLFLKKNNPNIYIDFNAIAQGYTVDVVHRFLKKKGFKNYIIEIGGEIYTSGKNILKNKDWVVAIDDPRQNNTERTFIETISLSNKGMATSGNYRKFKIDPTTGKKYVHTINPLTGHPKPSNILSTTVIAATAMKADGWATAFMLLDLDQTKNLVENQQDLDVFILYLDENNEMRRWFSKGFKKYVTP